uniref:Transposase n=1 Tax=Globodera pallida TaxID=36090 RepID=A0A183C0C4_GLOPA
MARPLYTSPERKAPIPTVELPEDIDMSVFMNPIPGRSWKADCAKRDHYLHGYALGHRAHLISLLRNLVREMFIFKVDADRQEARRRGEGICVNQSALNWLDAKRLDGWSGIELPSFPLSKRIAKRVALMKENQMMEESFGFSNYLLEARSPLLGTNRPFECRHAPHGVEPVAEEKPKPHLRRPIPTIAQKATNEWMVVVNGKAVPTSALKKTALPQKPIGYAPKPAAKAHGLPKKPIPPKDFPTPTPTAKAPVPAPAPIQVPKKPVL